MLPGVAYLEMARAAVEQACATKIRQEEKGISLKHIVWVRPIVADAEVTTYIELYAPEDDGEIAYEIYSLQPTEENSESNRIIHGMGTALLVESLPAPQQNIESLQRQCEQESFTRDQCYEAFRKIGIEYGPGQQAVERILVGGQERRICLLAEIHLPEAVAETHTQYVLHPSIIDGTLQASIGFLLADKSGEQKAALPFALDGLEIFQASPRKAWAYIREAEEADTKLQKLDIDVCDEDGTVCMRLHGFSTRVFDGEQEPKLIEKKEARQEADRINTLLLEPVYVERTVQVDTTAVKGTRKYSHRWVLLCDLGEADAYRRTLEREIPGAHCLILQSAAGSVAGRLEDYALMLLETLQQRLQKKSAGSILLQLVVPFDGERALFAALGGMSRTAQMENSELRLQILGVDSKESATSLVAKIEENSAAPDDLIVRYTQNRRQVLTFEEVRASIELKQELAPRAEGIYLITGGAGGLGLLFAEEFSRQAKGVKFILTGRSQLTEEKSEQLKKLEEMGAQVEYQQVDVVNRTAVDDLLRGILDRYGKLDGIVHSAGVVRDSLLLRKTPEDLRAVLAPKVKGVVNLDDASRELPLDFFLMFSSLAGALGNMGQADYATGNAFMDAYANYRQQLVEAGSRHGQSLSINWPLWEDGGMHVSPTVLEIMRKSMGLTPLSTEEGIAAFYQALACKRPQVVVLSGELQRLRKAFRLERNTVEPAALPEEKDLSVASEIGAGLDPLKSWASLYFRKLIGATLQMPLERIEADTPLENYGIDSVIVMQLTGELEKSFGSLSKTLLYEHQTIEELAEYFVQKHSAQLRTLLGIEEKTAVPSRMPAKPVSSPSRNGRNLRPARVSSRKKQSDFVAADAQEIAVIGISGRYPLARNVDELWENLKAGKDCVTEIPQERWDHSLYFDPEKGRTGKSYSKWGGFLEGIDEFDPLFFNISPREALYM